MKFKNGSMNWFILRNLLSVFSVKSITAKMIATTILLVAIPLAATNMYGYFTYAKEMEQQIHGSFMSVSEQMRERIDNMVQQSYNSMTTLELNYNLKYLLSLDPDTWRDNPVEYMNASSQIQSLFSWQQGIRGLFVIPAKGGVLYEYVQGIVQRDYPFTEQGFFYQAQRGKKFIISGPHPQEYVGDKLVFSIDKPVYDTASKEFLGVIRLDLDAGYFYRFFQNMDKGELMVLSQAGKVIYQSAPQKDEVDHALLSLVDGEESGFRELQLNGVDSLVSYNRSSLTGWNLVGIVPKSEIYLSVYAIRNTLIWLSLGTFIAILLCTAMLISSILKPIYLLNQRLIKMGQGDFTTRILSEVPAELKFIVDQYNLAVERLKHLTDELFVSKLRQQEAEIAAQQLKIDQQATEMKRQETLLRQRDAEMSQLQAQINPHFLYNTLSSIDSMADMERTGGIKQAVKHLSHMLRYSVEGRGYFVPLSDELSHVNAFVQIQTIRYGSRITFQLEASPRVMQHQIIRLTLQPLVENAYFHGLEPKLGGGCITLSIKEEEEHIRIVLSDDGVGMSESRLEELKSFAASQEANETERSGKRLSGLYNVIRRLGLAYPHHDVITMESVLDQGTTITVKIPKR
ncbi:sensor histidine kinase [Paenibacillus pasadenensis]|uniref:sensor histidine kinase n=1 Tax=Paenibacillus pasadenensis TaxID=217090 RepID=UPI00203AD9FA|nr:sensor histidine kinase [Paenibacillus pasadenensis]